MRLAKVKYPVWAIIRVLGLVQFALTSISRTMHSIVLMLVKLKFGKSRYRRCRCSMHGVKAARCPPGFNASWA